MKNRLQATPKDKPTGQARYRPQAQGIKIIAILFFLITLIGCQILPKKAEFKKEPEIEISEKEISPFNQYQSAYIYWKSWHQELIERLGVNTLKDKQCFKQTIENLERMANFLDKEQKEKLSVYISSLSEIKQKMEKKTQSSSKIYNFKKELEKIEREIKREFAPQKVFLKR